MAPASRLGTRSLKKSPAAHVLRRMEPRTSLRVLGRVALRRNYFGASISRASAPGDERNLLLRNVRRSRAVGASRRHADLNGPSNKQSRTTIFSLIFGSFILLLISNDSPESIGYSVAIFKPFDDTG